MKIYIYILRRRLRHAVHLACSRRRPPPASRTRARGTRARGSRARGSRARGSRAPPPPGAAPPAAAAPHPLRNRAFVRLWAGSAVSLAGDQFYLVALPWVVL